MKQELFRLVIVDDGDFGPTLQEMFERAVSGDWLRVCVVDSIERAWIKLGGERREGNGVLVHGSMSPNKQHDAIIPESGAELAQRLQEKGYFVEVYTVGGGKHFIKRLEEEIGGVDYTTYEGLKEALGMLHTVSEASED